MAGAVASRSLLAGAAQVVASPYASSLCLYYYGLEYCLPIQTRAALMPPTLRLSQKALILVMVPLMFQFVFVGTFAWLLRQSEAESARQTRTKNLLAAVERMEKVLSDAMVTLYLLKQDTTSNFVAQRYANDLQIAKEQLAELPAQSTKTDKERELVRKIEEAAKADLDVLNAAHSAIRMDPSSLDKGPQNTLYRMQMVRKGIEMMHLLHSLTDEEERDQGQGWSESQWRAAIWPVLIGMIGFNVALALALAIFFHAGTMRRMQVVMGNLRSLSHGLPLNKPLAGADEIAQIDQAFHSMKEALEQAARKERAIVDNAADVIFVVSEDNRFTSLSPSCRDLFGYEPEELVGSHLTHLIAEGKEETLEKFLAIKSGKKEQFEGRVMRKDGQVIDVRWSVQWSPEEASYYCVAHDISDTKKLERIKKEFVSMIGHDLRSPLMSVQAELTLLAAGAVAPIPQKVIERLTDAESNINYVIGLINSLLDVERVGDAKLDLYLEPLDLREVVPQAVNTVESLARKHQITVTSKIDVVDDILGDHERLRQVLINLLSNAIKFSPSGSAVELHVRDADEGDEKVVVEVADRGRGVPDDLKDSIFDRFHQAESGDRRVASGAGLGLSIVKDIVERHRGTVGVRDNSQGGSIFWFTLPKA